ncbi:MAG: hypothetical protein E7371_01715 [Clostridiales bacterium]|nr:hypothetical protein [Clostridiales bacterium]
MNEEIEYAEMLEIPVSTVNVIRKTQRRRKNKPIEETAAVPIEYPAELSASPLKDTVIAQVNDRVNESQSVLQPPIEVEMEPLAENENEDRILDFDPIPERIDTVRLYSEEETNGFLKDGLHPQDFTLKNENDGGRYALNYKNRISSGLKIALNAEFIAACALCGAIFLTNVFMPNSAINTFFRSMSAASATAQTDPRVYTDFTLSSVVSELSDAELSLSPAGILSFTDECHVYPAVNGTVQSVTQTADGDYTVKIGYSDTFTGIVNGLDRVYYIEGDEVKANVPLGYSDGENEVQVTMYSGGVLLNCFQLTEENCLAWVEAEP